MRTLAKSIVQRLRQRARKNRSALFRANFRVTEQTKILDLGSQDGSHIALVLSGLTFDPSNVYIADIKEKLIEDGKRKYGFQPVLIPEDGRIPFPDKFFDIVFCSSVIEHVTVPKSEVWSLTNANEFRRRAIERQTAFVTELKRVAKSYFVQTPNRGFIIESHTWLPFMGWLPRPLLVSGLRWTNKWWIKKSGPDFYLLDRRELASYFEGSEILSERALGMCKSIIAVGPSSPALDDNSTRGINHDGASGKLENRLSHGGAALALDHPPVENG